MHALSEVPCLLRIAKVIEAEGVAALPFSSSGSSAGKATSDT
jgi:hypothetical protein